MYRNKTKIIIVMLVAIVFMAVGYAILSTSLNINGSTAVTSNWQVEFSDIRTVSLKGGATNKVTPTVSKTTANFEVDLVQPGDEVTYEIDITNYGDIEAEVKGATYTGSGSEAIYVRFEGIRKGTRIASCEGQSSCPTVTITLRVGYDPSVTSDPEEKTKDISITLNIGQYVSSNPTPDGELLPELKAPTLVEQILNDNSVQSDENIDFNAISSDTNGKGLYYTNENTEDNETVYYFRGEVENNYVQFGEYQQNYSRYRGYSTATSTTTFREYDTLEACTSASSYHYNCTEIIYANVNDPMYWRIVRINEDGSVRLIYQGTDPNSTGNNTTIGSNFFNQYSGDQAYIGYMYGTAGSNSYEATHANTNDSTIKETLDLWYRQNLLSYSSYIADAGFCGDRSTTDLGYGASSNTTYGLYNRVSNGDADALTLVCPQNNDLYTTASSNKGNKVLDYPVGLLTVTDAVYAGGGYYTDNLTYYLYSGSRYWTMSPTLFANGAPFVGIINETGEINGQTVSTIDNNGPSIRPVINLIADVEISGGAGTSSDPYVIA